MQYRLAKRVVQLGWSRGGAQVIEDDLREAGTSNDKRYYFQRLLAEVGLNKSDLVINLDASPLAG